MGPRFSKVVSECFTLQLVRLHSSLKVIPVVVLVLSIHLVRCRPLLLLPSTFPSIIIFSNPCSARITCPKYESCCLVMMASKERPGLISSNTDLLVLLAVQGILSNLLQIHNSKESIYLLSFTFPDCPTFTTIHYPGKTIALTILILVDKEISISFIILDKPVIAILPRVNVILISPAHCPFLSILEQRNL